MILELISCVGVHWILKYGTILNLPRSIICKVPLLKCLFACSLCLGFWAGVGVGVYMDRDIILFGFASAGCCWFFDNINNVVQSCEIKLDNDS